MDDYKKQAKIEALDKEFPGMNCGNPRCEELCAEVLDAAKDMRLDPVEAVRKTIEQELGCRHAEKIEGICRFGFTPKSDTMILSGEGREIIHVFRTGTDECRKCQDLDGTRISPEVWTDESKMKAKGFWKQKNGEYLPHPNCRCHWEKEIAPKAARAEKQKTEKTVKPAVVPLPKEAKAETQVKQERPMTQKPTIPFPEELTIGSIAIHTPSDFAEMLKKQTQENIRNPHPYPTELPMSWRDVPDHNRQQTNYATPKSFEPEGKEVEFCVKDAPGKFSNYIGLGNEIDGVSDLLTKLEKNNKPHSIGILRITGHGSPGSAVIGVSNDDNFQGLTAPVLDEKSKVIISRLKRMFSSNAILELRMCDVGVAGKNEDKNGPSFAQKLADRLGCRVKVYLEPVNAYGWSKSRLMRRAKYKIYEPHLDK